VVGLLVSRICICLILMYVQHGSAQDYGFLKWEIVVGLLVSWILICLILMYSTTWFCSGLWFPEVGDSGWPASLLDTYLSYTHVHMYYMVLLRTMVL
jgi:hypothetical protein